MSENDIEILKRDVSKILGYLHNDDGTGKKGLVAEVESLKSDFAKFMSAYKIEKSFKKGQISIIAFIGGGFALFIEWLIKVIH